MEDILLKIEQLYYTYQDGTHALNGIDLEIKKGEKVAIMGANGSGKSTFFLHLNGILKPQKGMIKIHGKPIDYSRKGLQEIRKKVGIVFQDPDNQLFSANVRQEISFGLFNLGYSNAEAKEKVDKIVDELEITEFQEKPTHFLSGGQKKRVAIADVLVMEPEVMILDEPVSSLDPKHARMIDEITDALSEKGITLIISTHNVERALLWADRVVLFHEGRIVGQGKPEEIFKEEKLLKMTNLEKPIILSVFDTLCKCGVLDKNLSPPHSLEKLEQYIEEQN